MRYRKFILMIVVSMSGLLSAAAETSDEAVKTGESYFGWRLGCDISCPGKVSSGLASVSMFTHGLGVEFGTVYHISFVSGFYFEPGIKVYYDAYGVKEEIAIMAGANNIKNWSVLKCGFRIPVMVGYSLYQNRNIGVSLFTGPELEIGLTAYERIKRTTADMSNPTVILSTDMYADKDGLKRIDALWTLGAGVCCRKFYLSLSGSLGMLNMAKATDSKFHENRITVGVGYNF